MILKVTSRFACWGKRLFLPFLGCRRAHLRVRNISYSRLSIFFLIMGLGIQQASAMKISSDTQVATAGYFQLKWNGQTNQFLLQESTTNDFKQYKQIYKGKDMARVISGKPDGDYFYRVRSGDDSYLVSNVVKVTVAHHPLENAFMFFIAGAIVFVSTLILIIKGNKKDNN